MKRVTIALILISLTGCAHMLDPLNVQKECWEAQPPAPLSQTESPADARAKDNRPRVYVCRPMKPGE